MEKKKVQNARWTHFFHIESKRMLAPLLSALASIVLPTLPQPVQGHGRFLVSVVSESEMRIALSRWCLEEALNGEHHYARDFRTMSEWPIYINPYERRTCLGLFRVTDSSHPVCLIQLKTHLSSPFTVAGLAIPGKEIDDAPGILEALHALGMTIVYQENTLELVFE